MQESSTNCPDCVHVREKAKLEGGGFECRVNPPQVLCVPTPQGLQIMSMFPPVNENMSCALFEPDLPDEPTH